MTKIKPNKNNETLNGVKCMVETCKFNTYNGGCTASEIKVQPSVTLGQEEPDCATFKLREE